MNETTETELPYRLPTTDYPDLAHVLDDVVVLGFWVQRTALLWLPRTPKNEHLKLWDMESNLADLEHAVKVARAKVQWRARLAEATAETERLERVQAGLDEAWTDEEEMCQILQEPRFTSSMLRVVPDANGTAA